MRPQASSQRRTQKRRRRYRNEARPLDVPVAWSPRPKRLASIGWPLPGDWPIYYGDATFALNVASTTALVVFLAVVG